MTDTIVSVPIFRAAKLFTAKDGNPASFLPWAVRMARQNLVIAFDGPTLFVARDTEGEHFPRKPRQVGGGPWTDKMPGWTQIIRNIPKTRRALNPVAINPRYHARVMRAASLLGIPMVSVSIGGSASEITYHLGPDVYAIVMPMRDDVLDRPVVPAWLAKVVA